METKNIVLATIGVLIAGFIVALVIFNMNESSKHNNSDTSEITEMHEEYPGLPEENRFVKESGNETVERFTSGTGVIFLGFKECPWCQKTAPLINEAAESEDVSIYYTNIRQERENTTSAYQEIVSILSPHLPKDEEGGVRISTPDISIVKDGEIIWRFEMESVTEAEMTPETYWTEERQARAIQKFKDEMKKLHS